MVFRVPRDWDENDLRAAFEEIGPLLSSQLFRARETGCESHRGMGKITFRIAESVDALFARANPSVDKKSGRAQHTIRLRERTLAIIREQLDERGAQLEQTTRRAEAGMVTKRILVECVGGPSSKLELSKVGALANTVLSSDRTPTSLLIAPPHPCAQASRVQGQDQEQPDPTG
jgi:hypothetical protein